jgi:hypothetical protein
MYKTTLPGGVVSVEQRGSSSIQGTRYLCAQLRELFSKHEIKSMFDAGANDASWQMQTIVNYLSYSAGDHDYFAVSRAKELHPNLCIEVHDMTQDPFPMVDLLFVRDVTIHMNNFYKRQLLNNWLSSSIPWLLTTNIEHCDQNLDQEQLPGEWYFAEINWNIGPWFFPTPVERIQDFVPQRSMSLWHRDQIKGLPCVQ